MPWVVGAGRTWTDRFNGQTTIAPGPFEEVPIPPITPINQTVADKLLRTAGDGFIIFKADQLEGGAENVTRRYIVDHTAAQTGAAATVVVSDSTTTKNSHWRMNTVSFNTVTTSGNTFTFTSPDGKTMRGTVLWPAEVTLTTNGATVLDRTHVRFPYKDIGFTDDINTGWGFGNNNGNNWVDFQMPDGKAVVVLTVVDNGVTQPSVVGSGTGNTQTITVGSRVFNLDGDSITVAGWERPAVTVTSPTVNQNFNAGTTSITTTGTVVTGGSSPIERVEVYLDKTLLGNATLTGGNWSYSIPSVAVGTHTVSVIAYDLAKNARQVDVPVKVNNSVPPVVALTWPGPTQQFYDQQQVTLLGSVSDPDGTIARVEIWVKAETSTNAGKFGDATLGTGASAGTWSYTLGARPAGKYTVYAVAVDNSGDETSTDARPLLYSRIFGSDPILGDAGRYSRQVGDSSNWTTVIDETGAAVLQPTSVYNTDVLRIPGSTGVKSWELRFKAKLGAAYTGGTGWYHVKWGPGTQVILKMGTTATQLGPGWSPVGTNMENSTHVYKGDQNGNPSIGTLKWSPYENDGVTPNEQFDHQPEKAANRDWNNEYSGIPNFGWNNIRITKVDKTLNVWVNDFLIISGTDAQMVDKGPVGFESGTTSFKDIQFQPLTDDTGLPIVTNPGSVTVTAPAANDVLTAAAALTLTGTWADADGLASVEVFDGFTKLGTATTDATTWSYAWTVPASGTHALWARLTDTLGNVTDSAPVTTFVGSAPDTLTALTLGENTGVTSQLGLTGSATTTTGLSLVQIYRNGVYTGNATLSGNTWTWSTADLSAGTYDFTAIAYDTYGRSVAAPASFTATIIPPAAAITAPAGGASVVVGQPCSVTTTLTGDKPITTATFYANERLVGYGSNTSGSTWTFVWTPQFYGATALKVVATDNWGTKTTSASVNVTVIPDSGDKGSVLAYIGGATAAAKQELLDVHELSDGTLLIAGVADNLGWTTASKATLGNVSGLPYGNTGKTAFLLHVSADLQSVLGLYQLPDGQVQSLRWIKATNKPGATTGDLYVSGALDTLGNYFIGKLNNNFVNGAPTGFAWTRTARLSKAYGDHGTWTDGEFLQTWDVGGDGTVVFANDAEVAADVDLKLRVEFLDANGAALVKPDLRATHYTGAFSSSNREANDQFTITSAPADATASVIRFPRDLRSWTDADRNALLSDGNGSIKKGTWPLDIFYPVRDKSGNPDVNGRYGYTGYFSVGQHRLGGITVDRDTGDFYLGFNIQSKFWDDPAGIDQPDFEPAVIAYSATGAQKWWSRLYAEVVDANGNGQIDSGETRISLPDQYVDGLAVDYSDSLMTKLVVNARGHGNDNSNFWKGHQIAAFPSAQGFHNQFTGAEGNIHISWIGKLKAATGDLQAATYLAGFWRKQRSLTQNKYPEPIHDGWPSHNDGWQNLTTTIAEPGCVRVDPAGRVYVVGVGPRMVTTFNAHQKQPKITNESAYYEGTAPWAAFVRVFEPNLATLAYSSCVTGVWSYDNPAAKPDGEPVGVDNTALRGVFPTTNGALIVGMHNETSGVADGHPIPVNKVPSWALSAPNGQTGIFGRMSFLTSANVPPSISSIANQNCYVSSAVGPITFTVGDLETAASALTVTATSSNTSVLSDSGIVITGTGTDRDLTLTPAPSQTGTANVTVTVSDGAKSTSSTFKLTVVNGSNVLPTVTLTAPTANAVFPVGSPVSLTATASDSDGTIARVDFFVNGNKEGSDTTSPYAFNWNPPGSGIYSVYARAVDNVPGSTNSTTVKIYVGTRSALPVISTAAAAAPSTVTGTTTALSVAATDADDTAATLTYTWSVVTAPSGGNATFSPNGTSAAKNATATFTKAGSYTLKATVSDSTLGTAESTVDVTVTQTATSISVTPASTSVAPSSSVTFTGTVRDQFGDAVSPAPTLTWSVDGGGTINSSGVYSSGSVENGPWTITATSGALTGTASITVHRGPTLTTQPVAASANETGSASFSIAATSTGSVSYQWQKDGVNLSNGGSISGSGTATLTLNGIVPADAALYRCVATDSTGSTTSNAVALTVNAKPVVTLTSPTSLAVGLPDKANALDLTATATDDSGNAPTLTWSKVSGPGTVTFSAANSLSTSATFAANGTYVLRLTASDGAITGFSELSVTVGANAPLVVGSDVGGSNPAGTDSYDSAVGTGGTYTLTSSGGDIWNQADFFRFLWTRKRGDFTVTARVASFTATGGWAKAGIMARQDTSPGSAYYLMPLSKSNGAAIQYRLLSGASSGGFNPRNVQAPCWVRLVRSGAVLTGSTSTDGVTWVQGTSVTLSLNDPVLIGLIVSSHQTGGANTATATFDNVTGFSGYGTTANNAPQVAAGTATGAVSGTAFTLDGSVTDDGQPSATTSIWTKVSGPSTVTFGNAASPTSNVTFGAPGTYVLRLSATDTDATVSADRTVVVTAPVNVLVPTTISVTPASQIVMPGSTGSYSATVLDQNGDALNPQPTINWSVSGGGSINASGVFTGGSPDGVYTITASTTGTNALSATASVSVESNPAPTLATAANVTASTNSTADLAVLGTDVNDAESTLTYTWSKVSGPAGSTVAFSVNGSNAAKATTATFNRAGAYVLKVLVADAGGRSVQSTVNHTVIAVPTTLTASPASTSIEATSTASFSASVKDQFVQPLGGQTITWSTSGGGTVSTSGVYTAGGSAGGPFTVTATLGALTASGQVSIYTGPVITSQPSSRTGNEGGSTTFTVSATGLPTLTYQWRKNGVNLTTGGNIVGATTVSLTLNNLALTDADTYSCVVSNPTGSTTSADAVLTINAKPVVTITSPSTSTGLPDLANALVLTATATDDGGTPSVTWTKASGPGSATFANNLSANTSVTFSVSGTYVLRLSATDGTLTRTADVKIYVGTPALAADGTSIGTGGADGSSSVSGGTYTVLGAGGEIWSNKDRLYYVSTAKSGDFTLTARVASLTAVSGTLNSWAKAGIMVRTSTAANAANAMIAITPGNGAALHWRPTDGGSEENANSNGFAAPYWLRLVRTGNTFAGYRSPDGITWTQQYTSQTIAMTDPVQVGFAVSSNTNTDGQAQAVFDNVSGLPTPNNAPQVNPGTAPAAVVGTAATLAGTSSDDGQPAASTLTTTWSKISGPGTVTFGNASTAATTATFSDAGTYVLRLTATDGSATVFQDLTVTVTGETFTSWIADYPAITGSNATATADPDGDGVPNLLEYALGTAPDSSASRPILTSQISNSKLQITFTPQRSDVTYTVEASSDLSDWSNQTVLTGLTIGTAYTHTDTVELTAGTKRFLRLKVSQ